MTMTRRFFASLIAGVAMSLPVFAEREPSREVTPTESAYEIPGPLSPIRKTWVADELRAALQAVRDLEIRAKAVGVQ